MKFPKGFIWGTATAAYQIEGAWNVDGKGPSIWDTFTHIPGKIQNGDTGDVACDHYHRWSEDLDLAKGVAPNYRFSIAWPRVIPNGTGQINQKGIDFYNRLIDGCLEKGLTPWTTMYHWDLPQALQDKGGWTNRDVLGWFEEYAATLHRHFGDRVRNWMVLNEPSVTSYLGHALGFFAPGLSDEKAFWASVHHQNVVVGKTYRQFKELDSSLRVGSTYTPVPGRAQTAEAAQLLEVWENIWNWNYFDPLFTGAYPEKSQAGVAPFIKDGDECVKTDLDFVGLQHYSPIYFGRDETKPLGVFFTQAQGDFETNDAGWVIDPEAFTEMLLRLQSRYGQRPWIVTENGICCADRVKNGQVDDPQRVGYFERYLKAVLAAMDRGMKIDGYFVWSLLDNFEWADGYIRRFGLVYVDYRNGQKRIPKTSYYWIKNTIAQK